MSRDFFSASRFIVVPLVVVCIVPVMAYADSRISDPGANLMQVERQLQQQQLQLNDAQQKLKDQLKKLREQQAALRHQHQQIEALKSALVKRSTGNLMAANSSAHLAARTPRVSNAAFRVPRSAGAPTSSNMAIRTAQTAQAQTQAAPIIQSRPEARPQVTNISVASQGGVLTPKGVFSFEPTYQYQYASNNEVLISGLTIVPGITIGSTSVRQLVDRMQTVTLGGRLGITNRLEVEAEFPFVYRSDTTTISPLSGSNKSQTAINASGKDLGDVQFGAHYQLNSGTGGWPYFVANLLVKSNTGRSPFDVPVDPTTGIPTEMNTGTGFWAVQPSVTAIYPSDPVVFFANLRYIWNIARTVTLQPSTAAGISRPTPADINPGDGIGGSFGMGFGINDRASFSLAYEHTYLMSTTQNGATIPGSSYDIGAFDIGFSYELSHRTSVNLGVSIGATKAAPDAAITLRIPIKFQVF